MRLQARAYMLAHGANPDAMSEDDFQLVMVALNDGFIGNKKVLNTLGYLTTGVFNYIRGANSPAYSLENILGLVHDYIYRPLTDDEKREHASNSLLTFISIAPGAKDHLNV